MFVFQSRAAGQDVWQYSAAAGSGGAAEKGGEHQEDLRQPGRRGHQGEIGAHPRLRRGGLSFYRLTLRLVFTNISFQGHRV